MKNIIEIFERKGWALYRLPEYTRDIPTVIEYGKVQEFETGCNYLILPLIYRDKNMQEMRTHLEVMQKTGEYPRYLGSPGQKMIIAHLHIGQEYFYLYRSPLDGYRVRGTYENFENTIQSAVTSYHIYYFDNIGEVLSSVNTSTQQKPTLGKQLRWEYAMEPGSGFFLLYPSEANPVFFRGQVKRYRPCSSSIARSLPNDALVLSHLNEESLSKLIINLVKVYWFQKILEKTPQCYWLKERSFLMDTMALAQHYELSTALLDLTQSAEVGAFFACCKYENGNYVPVGEGEGVFYLIDLRLMPGENRSINAIGQQLFPRPAEQWGWTFELSMGEDFDASPYVIKFIFKHSMEQSEKIFKKFNSGSTLFPDDPLKELANAIKNIDSVPLAHVTAMIKNLMSDEKGLMGTDMDEIIANLRKYVIITDNEPLLLNADLVTRLQSALDLRKEDFLKSVGFRLVRTQKDNEDTP
ncbi:FRG domain-containing protein [Mucilaginibacter sp. X4EP1]|uniref:FRG domain-containing protein n=1 Tax=Mucilaginibacter sp. X4EP1 TaxID=2723092 RepID=UPI00216731E4|nr:FRG domain-containing protein [Mucilaginibacter sp. X4EP1]MCS3812495.1 hypothetical protein [Mucilaginibacter sp. X4EP1]